MNKGSTPQDLRFSERNVKFRRNVATDKGTNTCPDLLECRVCKEREKDFENMTRSIGDSKDSDLINNYVKAINYINTCHGIINEMNKKLSQTAVNHPHSYMSMPDLPNFLAIYTSLLYPNSDLCKKSSGHRSRRPRESERAYEQQETERSPDSIEELYARHTRGYCQTNEHKCDFVKRKNSRNFNDKLDQEQMNTALGEVCQLTTVRSKHSIIQMLPEMKKSRKENPCVTDTDESDGEYESRKYPAYSKEESYENQSDNDGRYTYDDRYDGRSENCNELKSKERLVKSKIPAPTRAVRKQEEAAMHQHQYNRQKMAKDNSDDIPLHTDITISREDLDKFAKELLENNEDTPDSSPRRDVDSRNTKLQKTPKPSKPTLKPRSASRSPSHERKQPNIKENVNPKSCMNIKQIPVNPPSLQRQKNQNKTAHFNSNVQQEPIPNPDYVEFDEELPSSKSDQRNATKPQNQYTKEENLMKNNIHLQSVLIQRANLQPKLGMQVGNKPKPVMKTVRSSSKSPGRSGQTNKLRQILPEGDAPLNNQRKLPPRPANQQTGRNPNPQYMVESKPNDFFTENRSNQVRDRVRKSSVRRSASGSVIISDKEDSDQLYTDSDIDEDHFQNNVEVTVAPNNKRKFYK